MRGFSFQLVAGAGPASVAPRAHPRAQPQAVRGAARNTVCRGQGTAMILQFSRVVEGPLPLKPGR